MSPHDGPLTVVIADDHAPTRAGIRMSLEADGFVVVAEVGTARAAVLATAAHYPLLALLDVHMPGGGITAAEQIGRNHPGTAVVMLSDSHGSSDLFDSLRVGARGFLVKDMNPDRLGAALRGVLDGEAALPRGLVAKVLEEFRGRSGRRVILRRQRPADLTSREWEVMELLGQGLSTDEVAARLYVSPGTVRVHVSSVVRKLRVSSRAEALGLLASA